MTFEALKLTRQFLRATEDAGYQSPTPVQEKAIPILLAGQDLIAIAQTGTGKTAAYLLPLLQALKFPQGESPRALILAPTKELVIQIHSEALKFARHTELRALALFGGVGYKTQLADLLAGQDLVVATPGRFLELYQRSGLDPKKIRYMVLDEADRMMDMGFMPQLRQIQELVPRKRQNMLFSATFPPRVERLADEFLLWPQRLEITPPATPATGVRQHKMSLPNHAAKHWVIASLLNQEHAGERAVIFVGQKSHAEDLTRYLETHLKGGVRALHSNKGQNARLNALDLFREGKIRCLVSTDVSSRGIDVPETRVVINFSVPRDPQDYVHRIGRTGRAFQTGDAYTLVDPSEGYALKRIESLTLQPLAPMEVPEDLPVFETSAAEKKIHARRIDAEMKRLDPNYQGAFHERKRKKPGANTRSGKSGSGKSGSGNGAAKSGTKSTRARGR